MEQFRTCCLDLVRISTRISQHATYSTIRQTGSQKDLFTAKFGKVLEYLGTQSARGLALTLTLPETLDLVRTFDIIAKNVFWICYISHIICIYTVLDLQ